MSNTTKRRARPKAKASTVAGATATPEILISIDLEWQADPHRRLRNQILRYGLRLEAGMEAITVIRQPKGPDRKHRLSLAANLGHIIAEALAKKVLSEVPEKVTVVMHYGRGDLAGHRDFGELKTKLDALKGTLATTRGSLRLNLDIDPKSQLPLECLPSIPDRRKLQVPVGGRQHEIKVTFRDTHLLVPEGRGSLAELGELVGVRKVELPQGYMKSEMGRFFEERPEEAEAYLRADLEIPIRYYQRLKALLAANGIDSVPPTLGACAVAWMRMIIPSLKLATTDELTPEVMFSTVRVKRRAYNRRSGKIKTQSLTTSSLSRSTYEHLFG